MHIVMIADQARLEGERQLLLSIARELEARSFRVSLIVPTALTSEMESYLGMHAAHFPIVHAPMRVLPWLRRDRVVRIMESFEKDLPRLVCAFGGEAWPTGEHLARELNCPLVFDICSVGEAKQSLRRRRPALTGCVTATRPLAEYLAQRSRTLPVRAVPWPVEIPAELRTVFDESVETKCFAVLGCGGDVPAHRALLAALSRLHRDLTGLQCVYELRGRNDHEIWRIAQRLDLLDCISFITSADRLRPLVIRADAVVMPECMGRMRSILLDAMAAGVPTAAFADPILDLLRHEETALLVSEQHVEPWVAALRRLATDVELSRRLGGEARRTVAAVHDPQQAADAYAETFAQAGSGGSLPFSAVSSS
jgi:glycosyltransferase involved in cell wall biosynthesis